VGAIAATLLAVAGLSSSVSPATAEKMHRIGVVLPGDHWVASIDGLKEGMTRLGYVQGQTIEYLVDNAQGDKQRVEEATRRFVAAKVDVIYTITNTALKVVIAATKPSRTPVVFGSASGPVESGIVPAYHTPDAHVTGVTSGSIELVPKRLEILKQVLPHVKRVVLIGDRDADSSKAAFKVAEEAAPKLGLSLLEIRVTSRQEAVEAAKRIGRKDADALFLLPSLHTVGASAETAQAARASRLPFAVYQVEHVQVEGALLSYGSSYRLQGRQAAVLVDKVLRGVPVAQLPIERPQIHHLVLNLDTAREIGVRFSPGVLRMADELVGGKARK
jgi:putative ABC transport system substrate-binding protein